MPSPTLARGNVITFASMLLWATTFPVTDVILETWDPLSATVARLWVGAVILLAWMALRGRLGELAAASWSNGFLVGGFGLTGAAVFLVWGLAYSDPVTVAIIAATVPLIAAVIGVLSRTERLTIPVTIGIVLAIAGGIVTTMTEDFAGLSLQGGEFFVILANIFWVWYSRASIVRLHALSDLAKSTLTMICSAVVVLALFPFIHLSGLVSLEFELSLQTISLVVWMAAVANGAAVVLWLWGARLLGVTVGSMHQNLVPFYVILLILPLGGTLHLQQVAGAVLVATGACLAQLPWGRGRHRAAV